jgi:hypothetical protein
MSAAPRSQLLDPPRRKLSELNEALFELAQRPEGQLHGAEPRVLAICRATGSTDIVLRRLDQTCHWLEPGARGSILGEWENRLDALLQGVREPCGVCGDGGGPAEADACLACLDKVRVTTAELEKQANDFSTYFPS